MATATPEAWLPATITHFFRKKGACTKEEKEEASPHREKGAVAFPVTSVLAFIHRLSALLFYCLGLTFFLAFVLLRNSIGGSSPEWWIKTSDLALLFVGLLYGGSSLYSSLRKEAEHPSWALLLTIGIPFLLLFLSFVLLNYWSVLL